MSRRMLRSRALLALGVSLARRGPLAVVALAVCAFTTLIGCVVAVALGARGALAPIHDVPVLASGALAWGGGFLLAFSAAAHALRKDKTEGIRALVVMRAGSLRSYVVARVVGLGALVFAAVAGGTLATGVVSVLAAARVGVAARALHATGASLVFCVAFAAVIAPLAFGALGSRSRGSGYLFLLFVVMLPELVAGVLSSVLSPSVAEVLSVPSALAALRGSLTPGSVDVARFVRALVALTVWTSAATWLVRRDVMAIEAEPST